MSDFERVCGLWKQEGTQGEYWAGKLLTDLHLQAGDKIYVFTNTRKETPKHPDLNVSIKRKEESYDRETINDEEIPF